MINDITTPVRDESVVSQLRKFAEVKYIPNTSFTIGNKSFVVERHVYKTFDEAEVFLEGSNIALWEARWVPVVRQSVPKVQQTYGEVKSEEKSEYLGNMLYMRLVLLEDAEFKCVTESNNWFSRLVKRVREFLYLKEK